MGNLAYVADEEAALQIIDVSNPASPVQVGGFDTRGSPHGVQVVGSLAYVADANWGLVILDMAEPPAIETYGLQDGGSLELIWNSAAVGMRLEWSDSLSPPNWQVLPGFEGTNRVVVFPVVGNRFYRLVRP